MEKPVYPTVHVTAADTTDLGFRITMTTHIPHEMAENVDQTGFVCGEMLAKLKEITDGRP